MKKLMTICAVVLMASNMVSAKIMELEITGNFNSAYGGTLYQTGDSFIATVKLDISKTGDWVNSSSADYVQHHSYETTLNDLKMDIYRSGGLYNTHILSDFDAPTPLTQSTRQKHPQAYTVGEELSLFGNLFQRTEGEGFLHTNIYAAAISFADESEYDNFDWDNYMWGDAMKLNGISSPYLTWAVGFGSDVANDKSDYYFDISNVSVVPEPATMLLLGLGAVGLLRKRKA